MTRNFKVGDKVRVREDLVVHKKYGSNSFAKGMVYLKGEIVEIRIIGGHRDQNNDDYRINGNDYMWTDKMFKSIEDKSDVLNHNSYFKVERVIEMDKVCKVESSILAFAMRYAMGRMTFSPSTVMDNIQFNIELFKDHEIQILIRDIDDHIGSFGMESDRLQWMSFKEYLQFIIEEREAL